MRRFVPFATIVASMLLAACASSAPPRTPPKAGILSTDLEYVAVVERTARSRGVDVRWVNPPKVRQLNQD
jgi:hypothetical protein